MEYNSSNRRNKYYNTDPSINTPPTIPPVQHTMDKNIYLSYIGRMKYDKINKALVRLPEYELKPKKFTAIQGKMIADAYQNNWNVKIFGAYRYDLQILADKFKYDIVQNSEQLHEKPDKKFNKYRQLMVFAEPKTEADKHKRELWVLVFPSSEYVDQTGELINAIFDDYDSIINLKRVKPEVAIFHFNSLEEELVKWSRFSSESKKFIRFGDVAIIGNVDFLTEGIEDFGFRALSEDWISFGLKKMFSVKTFVNNDSLNRVIVFGFEECFWGSASALYVDTLIKNGVRHVLYGSKAATVVQEETIWKTVAPQSLLTVTYNNEKASYETSANEPSGICDVMGMLSESLIRSGIGVTVPTVIGEDQNQREYIRQLNPAVMDCENGHIAISIANHNKMMLDSPSIPQRLFKPVKFLPIHFVTDFIQEKGQEDKTSEKKKNKISNSDTNEMSAEQSLATENSDPYLYARSISFQAIGSFFATYALRFGIEDEISSPIQVTHRSFKYDDVKKRFDSIKLSLRLGKGHAAVEQLLAEYGSRIYPIDHALTICLAAQKCGFIQLFQRIDDSIVSGKTYEKMSELHKLSLQLLRLKTATQNGDFMAASDQVKEIEKINCFEDKLIELDQIQAFLRRKLLLSALLVEQGEFRDCLKKSKQRAICQNAKYHEASNSLFKHIVILSSNCANQRSLQRIAKDLSNIRKVFSYAKDDGPWIHVQYLKPSIGALFVEAAMFIKRGTTTQVLRGMKILYFAHLMNVKFGGNETSEAYGEIVSVCQDPPLKYLLALAMRRDPKNTKHFQNLINTRYPDWTVDLKESADRMDEIQPSEQEKEIQMLIPYCD